MLLIEVLKNIMIIILLEQDVNKQRELFSQFEKEMQSLEKEEKKIKEGFETQKTSLKQEELDEFAKKHFDIDFKKMRKTSQDEEEQSEGKKNKKTLKEKLNQTIKMNSFKENPNVMAKDDESLIKAMLKYKFDKNSLPLNLSVRNLKSPLNKDGQIILFGVETSDPSHATYIYDALMTLKPQIIVTQLPPDLPFFIKCEENYNDAWVDFLKNGNREFLVSPRPQRLHQITLSQPKIEFFVQNSLRKADFLIDQVYISQSHPYLTEMKRPNILLSPFLFSYQNPILNVPVVVNAYPELSYRDYLAKEVDRTNLEKILMEKKNAYKEQKYNFDPFLLNQNLFIAPKMKYEIEVLKLCKFNKMFYEIQVQRLIIEQLLFVIIIVQNNMKHNGRLVIINRQRKIFLNLSSIKKINKGICFVSIHFQSIQFKEYLRKLCIIDMILNPFLQDNFCRYGIFPMDVGGTTDNEHYHRLWQTAWNDYIQKYK